MSQPTIKEQVNANADRVLRQSQGMEALDERNTISSQIAKLDRQLEKAGSLFDSLNTALEPAIHSRVDVMESPCEPSPVEQVPLVCALEALNDRLGNILQAHGELIDRIAL